MISFHPRDSYRNTLNLQSAARIRNLAALKHRYLRGPMIGTIDDRRHRISPPPANGALSRSASRMPTDMRKVSLAESACMALLFRFLCHAALAVREEGITNNDVIARRSGRLCSGACVEESLNCFVSDVSRE